MMIKAKIRQEFFSSEYGCLFCWRISLLLMGDTGLHIFYAEIVDGNMPCFCDCLNCTQFGWQSTSLVAGRPFLEYTLQSLVIIANTQFIHLIYKCTENTLVRILWSWQWREVGIWHSYGFFLFQGHMLSNTIIIKLDYHYSVALLVVVCRNLRSGSTWDKIHFVSGEKGPV